MKQENENLLEVEAKPESESEKFFKEARDNMKKQAFKILKTQTGDRARNGGGK